MADMRLDKLVSTAAGISRSDARKLITKGLVCVNNEVCKKSDEKVNTDMPLSVNGVCFAHKKHVYIMLNKPKGIVSASTDKTDTTVVDLVKSAYGKRELFPAGRLDKDSTGFVLITDDGALAHDILSPKHHIPKTYEVSLDVPATQQMQSGFEKGVTLADGTLLKSARLIIDENSPSKCTVIITQGVYHQIKRMFGVFDAGVVGLHRTAMGSLYLDKNLKSGQWRELTEEELQLLTK